MAEAARKPFTRIMLVATILFVGFHLFVPVQLPDAFLSRTGIGYLIIVAILSVVFATIICRLRTRGPMAGLGNDHPNFGPTVLPPHTKSGH